MGHVFSCVLLGAAAWWASAPVLSTWRDAVGVSDEDADVRLVAFVVMAVILALGAVATVAWLLVTGARLWRNRGLSLERYGDDWMLDGPHGSRLLPVGDIAQAMAANAAGEDVPEWWEGFWLLADTPRLRQHISRECAQVLDRDAVVRFKMIPYYATVRLAGITGLFAYGMAGHVAQFGLRGPRAFLWLSVQPAMDRQKLIQMIVFAVVIWSGVAATITWLIWGTVRNARRVVEVDGQGLRVLLGQEVERQVSWEQITGLRRRWWEGVVSGLRTDGGVVRFPFGLTHADLLQAIIEQRAGLE